MSSHDEQALAAAYVLGALEAEERRVFEAHVASCAVCREEVRSLQPVADALAQTAPQRTPRPELRSRTLAAITGSARAPAAPRPGSRRCWAPAAGS